MTIGYIKKAVENISDYKRSDETAHQLEDELYYNFIEYISTSENLNIDELKQKAKLILSTKEIKFSRWYS